MHRLKNGFLIAFSMYSTLPMPQAEWTAENMRYLFCFFPLIGGVIGAAEFGWLWICTQFEIGRLLAAAIATLLPVVLTGAIHLDGFCDTVDALASHAPLERKLEILKDSNVGAFALIGCCSYFLLSFGLWSEASFHPEAVLVLGWGFILSRALSGLAVVCFRCAKSSGLAACFADAAQKRLVRVALILWCCAAAAGMLFTSWKIGGCCLLAAFAAFGYYRWMSYREFGGITGDLAGYFLQICECAMLAAAVMAGGVWS